MNWGWKITLTFILFATFILVMVISMLTSKVDLVSDSYYQKEIVYQKQIESLKNANDLPVKNVFTFDPQTALLELQLPEQMQAIEVQGEVLFFRPSQKLLDYKVPLMVDQSGKQQFSLQGKVPGFWKAQLSFTYLGKSYFIEKELMLP